MVDADFTIADVLKWARMKPADEQYDYTEATRCAVAQFGLATGRDYLVGLYSWELSALSPSLLDAAGAVGDDATFGAFVKRLEALVPVTRSDWLTIDAYLADIERVSA